MLSGSSELVSQNICLAEPRPEPSEEETLKPEVELLNMMEAARIRDNLRYENSQSGEVTEFQLR